MGAAWEAVARSGFTRVGHLRSAILGTAGAPGGSGPCPTGTDAQRAASSMAIHGGRIVPGPGGPGVVAGGWDRGGVALARGPGAARVLSRDDFGPLAPLAAAARRVGRAVYRSGAVPRSPVESCLGQA